ncbi:MAG TPA: globin [Chloroflexota bacterium]|nr:globin [Chloroflexota bacterium]
MPTLTLYDALGGAAAFERLVDAFYAGVADDPILRPLYPEDLAAPAEHLRLFLMQYFGGPGTYTRQRGEPRLRLRHLPFRIGQAERDAWLQHMSAAVATLDVPELARVQLLSYFADAATFLINAPG